MCGSGLEKASSKGVLLFGGVHCFELSMWTRSPWWHLWPSPADRSARASSDVLASTHHSSTGATAMVAWKVFSPVFSFDIALQASANQNFPEFRLITRLEQSRNVEHQANDYVESEFHVRECVPRPGVRIGRVT